MKNKFFLFILVFFLSGSLTFAQEAPVETATEETTAEQPVDQTAAEAETAETDAETAEGEGTETAEAEEGGLHRAAHGEGDRPGQRVGLHPHSPDRKRSAQDPAPTAV